MLAREGWSASRIDALRSAIELSLGGDNPISRRLIDIRLRECGYQPHDGLRDIVERVIYPAYRDACLAAEQRLQKMMSPPFKAPPTAETKEALSGAPAEVSPEPSTSPVAPRPSR